MEVADLAFEVEVEIHGCDSFACVQCAPYGLKLYDSAGFTGVQLHHRQRLSRLQQFAGRFDAPKGRLDTIAGDVRALKEEVAAVKTNTDAARDECHLLKTMAFVSKDMSVGEISERVVRVFKENDRLAAENKGLMERLAVVETTVVELQTKNEEYLRLLKLSENLLDMKLNIDFIKLDHE